MVRVPRIGLRLNHRFSDEGGTSISECEQPSGDLRGRCAVVTGAARGIGLAIAERLLAAGADVIAVDKDGVALKEHFGEQDMGRSSACLEWDLATVDSPDSLTPNGEALAGKVLELSAERGFAVPTLIVNNAGTETDDDVPDLPVQRFDEVHRVNLRTPFALTQTLVKAFIRARGDGSQPAVSRAAILFISSLHATVPARRPHYSTSKAAVDMLVRELAASLGTHGIRVNAISPGWIRTDPDPTSPEQQAKERALVPRIALGRPGIPDDVAPLALTLLDDRVSGYVTGVNVPVDGGLAVDTWVPPPDLGWGTPR